jgi:hypothetical protein
VYACCPCTISGVTELLAALAALGPYALFATTVKVYAVSLVKPVTAIGEVVPDAVILSGEEITV